MGLHLTVMCLLVVGCVIIFGFVSKVVINIWWRPRRLKAYWESHGISGPPYKLFYGNIKEIAALMMQAKSSPMGFSHDILSRALPEIYHWTKIYGRNFVYWFGPTPRLVIPQPELIRELLSDKSGAFEKPEMPIPLRHLCGDGLTNSKGAKWARQRRLISPAFHLERLKAMVPMAVESTTDMLQKWENIIDSASQEIDVVTEFRDLTADIIAKTSFGGSFEEGKHIFDLQYQQCLLAAESFRKLIIPGYRFLPTKSNLKAHKIDAELQRALSEIIMNRQKDENLDNSDLLSLMMAANRQEKEHLSMSFQDIIDECKTFFVAGHETTAILLAWSIILLAMHTQWQDKAREEVLDLCNKDPPNAELLSRLKIVNMIVYEALRLYPPLPFMVRKASRDVKLGSFVLPKGTEISVPIAALHHDEDLWGRDAKEFNPQRFHEGVSKAATHQAAFMPFGFGSRICLGMNFSLIEAKVVLAMILQRFSWSLSPAYVHAPAQNFTIRPLHGAQIVLNKVLYV
ncbi:hypothetical protein SUGI_0968680 [Cryptomeria japonica]|uniref:cytochrome P450 734A1 n=1 Tax=Cryptomeria japonica TaxID=3369 RepID=UPI002414783E|nr:cytochrome P450 734A1 [Cryptomeria japonica]GLJ45996.1 hypothetical protein SUGI_0968680 [Cryptomeria japonica]